MNLDPSGTSSLAKSTSSFELVSDGSEKNWTQVGYLHLPDHISSSRTNVKGDGRDNNRRNSSERHAAKVRGMWWVELNQIKEHSFVGNDE
ncbi:hypothetical protein Q3G72_000705 [Acer saccharum]|nr:hypothetical protein Q3G72_000705 [Acer saccharum]